MKIKILIISLVAFAILGCQSKPEYSEKSDSELVNDKREQSEKFSNNMQLDSVDNEIKKIYKQIEEYQYTVEKLNAFKATNISIDRTNSGVPILKLEVLNTKRIDAFKGYLFVFDIYDVENNKKIDTYGFGATFQEARVLDGGSSSFSKKNYSLEQIVNENKRIQELLKTATLPNNNLKQFGLRIEFNVNELEYGDGTIINQPEQDLAFYKSEVSKLNKIKKNLEALK